MPASVDTADIVCRAGSMQWSCVRLSTCPSIHMPLLQVCCYLAGRRYWSSIVAQPTLSSSGAAARYSAANASSVMLTADVGSWTQTCLECIIWVMQVSVGNEILTYSEKGCTGQKFLEPRYILWCFYWLNVACIFGVKLWVCWRRKCIDVKKIKYSCLQYSAVFSKLEVMLKTAWCCWFTVAVPQSMTCGRASSLFS